MADDPKIKINQLKVYENLPNNNELVIYQGDSGGDRREKRIPPSDVGVLAGLKLTASRIAIQELTSNILTQDLQWWTIATGISSGFRSRMADFVISYEANATMRFLAGIVDSTLTKTHENSKIEILGKASTSITERFQGLRILKSDSVETAGAKVEVLMNYDTARKLVTQMFGNNTGISGAEWKLIEPEISTGKCADEVTVATALQSGEELSFEDSTMYLPINGSVLNDDTLILSIQWPEIPKIGTNFTLTDPSTAWLVFVNATSIPITGFTVSNFSIKGKIISFRLTKTGSFAGLANNNIQIRTNGTGGRFTII